MWVAQVAMCLVAGSWISICFCSCSGSVSSKEPSSSSSELRRGMPSPSMQRKRDSYTNTAGSSKGVSPSSQRRSSTPVSSNRGSISSSRIDADAVHYQNTIHSRHHNTSSQSSHSHQYRPTSLKLSTYNSTQQEDSTIFSDLSQPPPRYIYPEESISSHLRADATRRSPSRHASHTADASSSSPSRYATRRADTSIPTPILPSRCTTGSTSQRTTGSKSSFYRSTSSEEQVPSTPRERHRQIKKLSAEPSRTSSDDFELPSVGKAISSQHKASSVAECLNYTGVNSAPVTPTCNPLNMFTMGATSPIVDPTKFSSGDKRGQDVSTTAMTQPSPPEKEAPPISTRASSLFRKLSPKSKLYELLCITRKSECI